MMCTVSDRVSSVKFSQPHCHQTPFNHVTSPSFDRNKSKGVVKDYTTEKDIDDSRHSISRLSGSERRDSGEGHKTTTLQ